MQDQHETDKGVEASADQPLPPEVDNERRVALAKIGRLAAYTAPVFLATMTAAKAQRASQVIPN